MVTDATYLRLITIAGALVVWPFCWMSECVPLETMPCPSCRLTSIVKLSTTDAYTLRHGTGLIQNDLGHLDDATRELLMTGMHDACWKAMADSDPDCGSCGEDMPKNECPKSQRICGHHCNHSWTHDGCCWCGTRWDGEVEVSAHA